MIAPTIGRMNIVHVWIFLLGITCCVAALGQQERSIIVTAVPKGEGPRIALVVGNSRYADSPLRNPANDAADVADVLAQLNFDVTLLVDADFATMSQAVTEFGRELTGRDGVALFYFAGHGMQVNGRNFLIPVGGNIAGEDEVPYKAIDANSVLAKMEAAGSATNLVILDACRNNPFARSHRSGTRGLAQMDAPKGTLIVYATAPGDVAFDGDGENGIFTASLLQHIGAPDMDVELMFRQVRVDVLSQSDGKQTPWTASSLQGNFSFNGIATGNTAASTGGVQFASISPRRSWRRDMPTESELEDIRMGNQLVFRITADGHSSAADSVSRRTLGQKAALKSVLSALKTRLEFHDVKMPSSQLAQLVKDGEMVDLEYLDDGKTVRVTYEIPVPAHIASSIPASQ